MKSLPKFDLRKGLILKPFDKISTVREKPFIKRYFIFKTNHSQFQDRKNHNI